GSKSTQDPFAFEDRVGTFGVDVNWDGWRGQSWLAGVEYFSQEMRHASLVVPALPGFPPAAVVIDDKRRDVSSATLQDRIDLGERWSVTAGGRFDEYSDVGSRFTPRLSVVWRASDRHILKAQYAE